MEVNNNSSWRISDKIGEHDSVRRLTQGTVSLDPVKLGGLKKISGASLTHGDLYENCRLESSHELQRLLQLAKKLF